VTAVPTNHPALREDNIAFLPGAGRGPGLGMIALGALFMLGVLGAGLAGAMPLRHAMAAYQVGTMAILAICLGATFFVMVFHLLNAGWSSSVRRQFENVMALTPLVGLLLAPTLLLEIMKGGVNFLWLNEAHSHDYLLQKKAIYFFGGKDTHALPVFFILRTVFYVGFWAFLTRRLLGLSVEQDKTGSREASARARFLCAWTMPLFALSIAFVAFDYLMSLDYKFYSTMWGVAYFAGAAFTSSAVVAMILARLHLMGKLSGVVTKEHFHDMGKLMFSFTVFWAYITFCQYFLIWYSNIPEETSYYLARTREGSAWRPLGIVLMVGHFALPFLILLFRSVKKNPHLLTLIGLWAVAMHVADIFFLVRPMTYSATGSVGPLWIDALAIGGALALFTGGVIVQVGSRMLVAKHDPWIHEGLEHRNYV
jgi:hypothetical protein